MTRFEEIEDVSLDEFWRQIEPDTRIALVTDQGVHLEGTFNRFSTDGEHVRIIDVVFNHRRYKGAWVRIDIIDTVLTSPME